MDQPRRASRSPASVTTPTRCTPTPPTVSRSIGHLKHVIVARLEDGRPLVNTFLGEDAMKHVDQLGRRLWVCRTSCGSPTQWGEAHFKHCPMSLQLRRVAGGTQHGLLAPTLAAHPEQWAGTVGLNFDPSHLVWLMMDQGDSSVSSERTSCTSRPRTCTSTKTSSTKPAVPCRTGWAGKSPTTRARLGGLGPRVLGAVPCGLPGRLHHRARGPRLRGQRRAPPAWLPHRPRHASPVLPLTVALSIP